MDHYMQDSNQEDAVPRAIPQPSGHDGHVNSPGHHIREGAIAQEFTPTFSFEPSPVQILPPLHTHDQQGQMFQHDAPLPMSFQPPPTFTHYVSHSHFHPYRPSTSSGLRSPRFGRHSLSHPISTIPPGSAGPLHYPLVATSPSAISTALVSPASADESIEELSPSGLDGVFLHPHDLRESHFGSGSGNLSGQPSPVGPGIPMVQGYAGTARIARLTRSSTKSTSSSAGKRGSGGSSIKQEEGINEDGTSEETVGALGIHTAAPSCTPTYRAETYRRARIESEQVWDVRSERQKADEKRRRDELRGGYVRLKNVLPDFNQRASKANILDGAVAHIEQLQISHRFLCSQNEKLQREVEQLKLTNQQLVNTVAVTSATLSNTANSTPQSQLPKGQV